MSTQLTIKHRPPQLQTLDLSELLSPQAEQSIESPKEVLLQHGIDLDSLSAESYAEMVNLSIDMKELPSSYMIDASLFIDSVRDTKRELRHSDKPEIQEALCKHIAEEFSKLYDTFDGSPESNARLHGLRVAFELLNIGAANGTNENSTAFAYTLAAEDRERDDFVAKRIAESAYAKLAPHEQLTSFEVTWSDIVRKDDLTFAMHTCSIACKAADGNTLNVKAQFLKSDFEYAILIYQKPPAALHHLSIELTDGKKHQVGRADNLKDFIPKDVGLYVRDPHADSIKDSILLETSSRSRLR